MRLPFGLVLQRKAVVPTTRSSFWGSVREPFAGAWQRNMECDRSESILAFSPVYACVSRIASDVAKLRLRLVEQMPDGTWPEAPSTAPHWAVLRKPNHYQTRIQFMMQWLVSKLLYGNTYVLLQRDGRNIVTAMYVLDPRRVSVITTDAGDVYYRLAEDLLNQVDKFAASVAVPASSIIHDIAVPLFHPLSGVSPMYAAARTATQGTRIQTNSSIFFENMSRPSGVLSGPGEITDDTAKRLKEHWEANYTGSNIGRLAVLGDGLKYEAMTVPAQDAQLIQQLGWTVEDVARAFGIPLYKINSGPIPTSNNVEALEQQYYTGCLQILLESIELLLDEGLGLVTSEKAYGTEFELKGLLRMDTLGRYDAKGKAISAGWMAPNEARLDENLPPVDGGEFPMMQQQNWNLGQLAKRDIVRDAAPVAPPVAAAPTAEPDVGEAKLLAGALIEKFTSARHAAV